MKQCGYCHSRSILQLNNKYYCETCEIYYTYTDRQQEYSNLPIEDIDQMTVGDRICKSCRPRYVHRHTISCTTFREYFRKLPLCSRCKRANEKCIKNAFFKNFVLYKTYVRTFSMRFIAASVLASYFLREAALSSLLFVNLVDYRRNKFSLLGNALKSVLAVALHQLTGNALCYFYCLLCMLFCKRWIYDVPVNLDQSPDLVEYLEQLNIGSRKRM